MATDIPEIRPGKVYAIFKPKGERKWSAAIRLPDGFTEVFETDTTDMATGRARSTQRVRFLYKERGINNVGPIGIQKRQALGLPPTASQTELRRATMAQKTGDLELPPNGAPRRGRPPGSQTNLLDGRRRAVAIGDEDWGKFVTLTEESNTAMMMQVTQMLLLGLPAEEFQQTCRALVIRATQRKLR